MIVRLYEAFPRPGRVLFEKKPRSRPSEKACVLVTVDGDKKFKGIGNNYSRAKLAAATCAIRELKKRGIFPQ